MRPAVRKGTHVRTLCVAAATAVLAACAGENLFTGPLAGASGPDVEITSPTSGQQFPVGNSVTVEATATSQSGAAVAEFEGVYEADGTAAFGTESQSLDGLVNVSLTQELLAVAGQIPGTVVIIVSVTDQQGETGADSVTVTLAN